MYDRRAAKEGQYQVKVVLYSVVLNVFVLFNFTPLTDPFSGL